MRLTGWAIGLSCVISVSYLAAQESPGPQHAVQDWSSGSIVFTGLTPENLDAAVALDPRALHSWLDHARHNYPSTQAGQSEPQFRRREPPHRRRLRRDWQMNLGGSSVGPHVWPAKFSFDINAAPDCVKDYVVFPTDNPVASGSPGGRPSVAAFNNLYTGPGPTGICPTLSAPATQPSVLFAYNTGTAPTGQSFSNLSPVLSLDGTKIAFVENNTGAGGNYTAFHVLTWKAGEGTLTSAALPGNCSPGNSCMTTLVLSTTSGDRNSSPFVDYAHDTAYVGDNLLLHKITPVFGGTPRK
jgi:hypothetical protein